MGIVITYDFRPHEIFENSEVIFIEDMKEIIISDDTLDALSTSIEYFKISGYFGYASIPLVCNDLAEKGYYMDEDFTIEQLKEMIGEY